MKRMVAIIALLLAQGVTVQPLVAQQIVDIEASDTDPEAQLDGKFGDDSEEKEEDENESLTSGKRGVGKFMQISAVSDKAEDAKDKKLEDESKDAKKKDPKDDKPAGNADDKSSGSVDSARKDKDKIDHDCKGKDCENEDCKKKRCKEGSDKGKDCDKKKCEKGEEGSKAKGSEGDAKATPAKADARSEKSGRTQIASAFDRTTDERRMRLMLAIAADQPRGSIIPAM
ncbi:MAG: hypothetical protein LBJ42_00150 [Holosporales bacterium]|jgi:hypothetical protein|nr:hypothetical protein [Holosporales bacterium]